MELKHLRYFLAAVEEGSFQAAATRLNIAQPALSRRVRDLEVALNCQLLVRGARGTKPTPAGLVLYRDAQRVMDDLAEVLHRVQQVGFTQDRGVRIGLAPTIARKYAFVQEALAAASRAEPHGNIGILSGRSAKLVDGLREGSVDVALIYEQRPDSSLIAQRLIHRESYVLAVHPSDPLARRGPAELGELVGRALIWLSRRDNANGVNPMLLQLRRHGLDPVVGHLVDDPDEQLDLAVAGAGPCITPASTMLTLPDGKLFFRPLPRLDAYIDLTAAWRRDLDSELGCQVVAGLNAAIDRHQWLLEKKPPTFAFLDGYNVFQKPGSRTV
jgi:DNA-binding transcriptional LysR family regulator